MYLNNQIHTAADHGLAPEDLGAWYDSLATAGKNIFKSGSDIYQMQKNQQAAAQMQQQQQQYAPQAAGGSFLQKHGLKLAIGAGGLLVLFLVLKKKG